MLQFLLPRSHKKFLSLPLLGSIVDGFDDWLAENGYTRGSRKLCIRMLPHIDSDLRRRRVRDVASLITATLDACWRDLIKIFPTNAGTVRVLRRYLRRERTGNCWAMIGRALVSDHLNRR